MPGASALDIGALQRARQQRAAMLDEALRTGQPTQAIRQDIKTIDQKAAKARKALRELERIARDMTNETIENQSSTLQGDLIAPLRAATAGSPIPRQPEISLEVRGQVATPPLPSPCQV